MKILLNSVRNFILLAKHLIDSTALVTNTHIHKDADECTYFLHCQVFLIPGGSECKNPPTPNLLLTHLQYPFVHQLRKKKEDERQRKTKEEREEREGGKETER